MPHKPEKGTLDTILEFLMGPKKALNAAAAQGTPPAPQVTPAQDDRGLRAAVAESMARKAERDKMALTAPAAKALSMPPKRVRPKMR